MGAAPLLLSYMEQKEQQQEKRETRDGNVHVNEDYDQEDLDGDHAMTSYHPDYNFQEVIDVMKGYGLTSNDVCVLLTHSPSLALRIRCQESIAIVSKLIKCPWFEIGGECCENDDHDGS